MKPRSGSYGDRLPLPPATPAVPCPAFSDWADRPGPWMSSLPPMRPLVSGKRITQDVALFHDAEAPSGGLLSETREGRFRLGADLAEFTGSFLSLAIDLPAPAVSGLGRRHILRLEAGLETAGLKGLIARLNVKSGADTLEMVAGLTEGPRRSAEFDLAYLALGTAPITSGWIDLIFEPQTSAQVVIEDLILSRRPRLEL